LLGLAGLNVIDPYLPSCCPALESAADVLWLVIATNGDRLATPLNDRLKGSYHSQGRQREIDLDAKGLPLQSSITFTSDRHRADHA
jgi:hypothetical protein